MVVSRSWPEYVSPYKQKVRLRYDEYHPGGPWTEENLAYPAGSVVEIEYRGDDPKHYMGVQAPYIVGTDIVLDYDEFEVLEETAQ